MKYRGGACFSHARHPDTVHPAKVRFQFAVVTATRLYWYSFAWGSLLGAIPILLGLSTCGFAGPATTLPAIVSPDCPQRRGPEYVAVMSSFPEELDAIQAALAPRASGLTAVQINGVEFRSAASAIIASSFSSPE
jgi:hypothetical protein